MEISNDISDDERRTLIAEQDLLERVIVRAMVPGRIRRGDLDDLMRAVGTRCAVPRQRHRPEPAAAPRLGCTRTPPSTHAPRRTEA